MPQTNLPAVLEPALLEQHLDDPAILVVDLCSAGTYAQCHLPGAVHLDYPQILARRPPVMGLLPDQERLSEVLSSIGLHPHSHVVAYDDEGGAKACRFLWTLDVIGHPHKSLLNGGIHAWLGEGRRVETQPPSITPSHYRAAISDQGQADKAYLMAHLEDPSVVLLDARSEGEYQGLDLRAIKGGHIPGAINLEWSKFIDRQNNLRFKPAAQLRAMLAEKDISPDKTVVAYCQSHHRSALVYYALKALGYPQVKGYAGSWSEWGNLEETPVARDAD